MIQDKPFIFDELLRRTIFLGRPNFFNAKDLNKELLIIHSFIEEFNSVFAVHSTVEFSITSFSEVLDEGTNTVTRQISMQWGDGDILYKGIKFPIKGAGVSGFLQEFNPPNEEISPRGIRPNTYVVLTAEFGTVTYADNPTLCGIQADEITATAPTVDVEQYKNVKIEVVSDLSELENIICVLATVHPRYDINGVDNGNGFMYHTFNNPDFFADNGNDRAETEFANNGTMYEYIVERVIGKLTLVLNERQLVRRFNFADIGDFTKARKNLGFSNIVNRRQLVQAENLNDLTDKERARYNLGLGNSAVRKIGTGVGDVAQGNIMPVGGIIIWSGSRSSVPTGWALCEGAIVNEQQTPDLRGKFIVGVDTRNDAFKIVGKDGGAESSAITNAHLPQHSHSITDPGHAHSLKTNIPKTDWTAAGGEGNDDTKKLFSADSDSIGTSQTGITVNNGGGVSNPTNLPTLPPYYAFCYIMYVGLAIVAPAELEPVEALEYPNYSTPDNDSDSGYSSYTVKAIGDSGETVGAGVILTNPK